MAKNIWTRGSQNGVFAFHFCFSLFKTHLRKPHPAPSLWSDRFRPLALNMREHLKPLSLDTLFPSYLNQSKRVATGAAPGPAQPGRSWATGRLPGQHQVRHFPSRTVPLTFSEATWQSRHWTSWVPRWPPAAGQGRSQLGPRWRLGVAGRGAAERAGSSPSPA